MKTKLNISNIKAMDCDWVTGISIKEPENTSHYFIKSTGDRWYIYSAAG